MKCQNHLSHFSPTHSLCFSFIHLSLPPLSLPYPSSLSFSLFYRAIGSLAHKVFPSCESTSQYFLDSLRQMSHSNNATYKVISSLIIVHWKNCPSDVVAILLGSLNEQILYEELAPFLLSLQKECHVS